MEVSYTSITPSTLNGTDTLTHKVTESLEENEAFKASIHLQKVNIFEMDSHNNEIGEPKSLLQIEKEPTFLAVDLPNGFYPTFRQ